MSILVNSAMWLESDIVIGYGYLQVGSVSSSYHSVKKEDTFSNKCLDTETLKDICGITRWWCTIFV